MRHEDLKRNGDYADLPRGLAWLIMAVEKLGIPAAVIGVLLYICFVTLNSIKTTIDAQTVKMVEVISSNTNALNLLRREIKGKHVDD